MRVILYARVSTQEQRESGHSLAAQLDKLRAYAALYDHQVVLEISEGESGKSLKRPGLQQALAALKAKRADALIIAKLDRLTRSVADWQTLIDGYFSEKAGKTLCSVQDSIDTATAAGRLVLNVLLSVAMWEREAIAERTSAALQHKIKQGQRVGKVRFGYDLADDGKTLIPNAREQEAIQIMLQMKQSGASLREIVAELASHGIPTRDGKPWDHTSVRYIITRTQVKVAA